MTILISGVNGFLGSHLARRLSGLGYQVIGLKRVSSSMHRILDIVNEIKLYDIDISGLEKPFTDQKIDVVINTVTNYGRNKESVCDIVNTNLLFCLKLLETSVLFNTDTFFNTDTLLYKYLNHYSLSKKQFVEWLHLFSEKIQVINLKLEHMYGVGDDKTKFVSWLIESLLKNQDSINLTKGEQKRDFIYIDDIVDAYIIILQNLKNFEGFTEFDIGTGKQISVRNFVEIIYNKIVAKKNIKTALNFGALLYRDGEFMDIIENVEPLYNLGWRPQVSIEDGIMKILKEDYGCE